MTKARIAVLAILQDSDHPLCASEIARLLPHAVDQATVYRTLHYLEDHGFVEATLIHCTVHGSERYYTVLRSRDGSPVVHHHWFHCEYCHQFIDLGNCRLSTLIQELQSEFHLSIHSHSLALTGICPTCEGALRGASPSSS